VLGIHDIIANIKTQHASVHAKCAFLPIYR
jgi:hypothetical protein